MSWLGPMGKRALKYGPQAQLLWKHAAKPAPDEHLARLKEEVDLVITGSAD